MIEETANDDLHRRSPRRPIPDAHGQAALLLAESILHSLIEQGVLTIKQTANTVTRAAEVKIQIAADMGEPQIVLERSLALLRAIKSSLLSDAPGGDPDFGDTEFI